VPGRGGTRRETFPSGSLTLDLCLGGGIPRGRIVEVYGPESSGKTTLGLHALASMQVRLGKIG
jgi:recombination protein RecA